MVLGASGVGKTTLLNALTGLSGFDLKDVFVLNDENGRPFVVLENSAEKIFKKMCGNSKIHISLSNEKQFAVAYVIIESEN